MNAGRWTLAEAEAKAERRSLTSRFAWLVVLRTDHPAVVGDYFYAISEADKYAWTDGETLLGRCVDGERVTA